jgi:hypothetical protein
MKKLLFVLFALALFSISTQAQMQLGVKAGLNLANLSGDDISDTDARTGFAGGLFFMYQFNDMFAIQPEAYYSMKGATDKGSFEGYSYEAELKLDYLEIPLLLKFLIPIKDSNVRPTVFAGPSFGFNMSAKSKVEAGGQTFEQDIEYVASTDFGLVFGGGIGFPVGNGELGFDIRYILGLSTIDDSSEKDDVKNGVLNFNLYYGFNLK